MKVVSFASQNVYAQSKPAQPKAAASFNQPVTFAGGPPKFGPVAVTAMIVVGLGQLAANGGKRALKFVSGGRLYKDVKPMSNPFRLYNK